MIGNRRNVRNMGRFSGSSVRRAGMSRRRFIGGVAAGVGAAAMAGAGLVKAAGENVTIRPLEDWFKNNLPSPNWVFIAVDGYYVATHHDRYISGCDGDCPVMGETEYDGYVLERVLDDGRVEITVHVNANNAPMTVYRYVDVCIHVYSSWHVCKRIKAPQAEPILGKGADGYIDYSYTKKFILPPEYAPGDEIPDAWGAGIEPVSTHFSGMGEGIFTGHARESGYSSYLPYNNLNIVDCLKKYEGIYVSGYVPELFTPGKRALVTVSQVALDKAAARSGYKGALEDGWPAEIINVQEVGSP